MPGQTRIRVLHVGSAPDADPMQARLIRLIEGWREAEHALVGDGPAHPRGRARLARPAFPPLAGGLWPGRLKGLAEKMAGYDLLLTWGAGALDAVLAHTLFADAYRLAPLVHHESGEEEGGRSTMTRRLALGRTAALVVPARRAERLALGRWQQPRSRVRLIPDGIDTAAFANPPRRDAIPGLVKRRGEWWLGTVATGEAEHLPSLVRALAALPEEWQLVIAGETARPAIVAEAERLAIDHRVLWTGPLPDPTKVAGLFDLFAPAASGDGILQAMAAGLPLAGAQGERAEEWTASDNGPFLTPPGDEAALHAAIADLAADPGLRHRIGQANRARARAEYDTARMAERSLALYRGLVRRD